MIEIDELLVYSFIATMFLIIPVTLTNSAALMMTFLAVLMVTGAYTLAKMSTITSDNDRQRF